MLKKEWFPEYTWAHFGLLLDASIRNWRDPNATREQKEGYRFLTAAIPAILQTAEHINRSKITNSTPFPADGPQKKQDGFFAVEECPDYIEQDLPLKAFLRGVSGEEKYKLLLTIWKATQGSKNVLFDQETERIVKQRFYAQKGMK